MARLRALSTRVQPVPKRGLALARTERIRGRELQRIRTAQFMSDPLCARCNERGIVRLGVVSDHTVALENGGAESIENRQLLCVECHIDKTREDNAIARGGGGSKPHELPTGNRKRTHSQNFG